MMTLQNKYTRALYSMMALCSKYTMALQSKYNMALKMSENAMLPGKLEQLQEAHILKSPLHLYN